MTPHIRSLSYNSCSVLSLRKRIFSSNTTYVINFDLFCYNQAQSVLHEFFFLGYFLAYKTLYIINIKDEILMLIYEYM